MYSLQEYLAFFVIYAFLGWCAEVVFNTVNTGHFVNRGFLHGPVCPIYGFGVGIVIFCLSPLKDNWLLLFVGAMVLSSVLEGVTGYVLEKAFHTSWWDYSNEPFHIGKYVCLRFSILWGLGCVLVMDLVHPAVVKLVRWIPAPIGTIAIAVCLFCFACDFYVTASNILKFNRRLGQLEEVGRLMQELSDAIGGGLADGALKLAQTGDRWKESSAQWKQQAQQRKEALRSSIGSRQEQLHLAAVEKRQAVAQSLEEKKQRLAQLSQQYEKMMREKMPVRLLKAFPNAKSQRYNDALERIRQAIEKSKGKTNGLHQGGKGGWMRKK